MAVERSPSGSSLIDVLDRVLDKGIVIDAWVRVSLVGIDLVTVEARVVVASIDTYLKYSEAVGITAPDFPRVSRHLLTTVRAMSEVKLVRRWPAVPAYKSVERPITAQPVDLQLACIAIAFAIFTLAASEGERSAGEVWASLALGGFGAALMIGVLLRLSAPPRMSTSA